MFKSGVVGAVLLLLAGYAIQASAGSIGYRYDIPAGQIRADITINGLQLKLPDGTGADWLCSSSVYWKAKWSDPQTEAIVAALLSAQAQNKKVSLGFINQAWTNPSCYTDEAVMEIRLVGIRIIN